MERQLVTFSLLSTQWTKYNKSYLDNFVPLFATLLVEKTISHFEQKDYSQLADEFKKEFSLPLPAYLVSSLVAKLMQLQFITKENGKYIVDSSAIIQHGFYIKGEIDFCDNKKNIIFTDFIQFCNDKYKKDLTVEDANRIVLSFIKENDADIIFQEVDTESSSEELFLIGKYTSTLFLENPDLYKDFVNFAVGSIAFHAMYLAPIESESESLKKCVFYFDSSFVFPLLGIDSMQREEIIKEIIKEIRLKGGFVKIYKHTYDEIVEILETAIKYVESPLYDARKANKALCYLRQEGFSATRVELILASLGDVLKQNYIDVENQIPDKKLGINEDELTNEITKNLSLRQYDSVAKYAERTKRDVNSIIYTYEKRKKIISKDFIDAKYSFITENALLTTSDKKIVLQYSDIQINEKEFFPAAIPEAMLCAYLYLGSSEKAVENITMSVLATAFAAIRPTAELEALIKDTANKLMQENRISESAYNLVMATHLIKDCLAERTLTSYERVNEDTIFELIEDAKDSVAIEERKKRKEAETKLFIEQTKDKQRKHKAEKNAKRKRRVIFFVICFVLIIPYIFSGISFFNFNIKITLGIFIGWTVFCFAINHIKSISLKSIWGKLYNNLLRKEYEYFELNFDDLNE